MNNEKEISFGAFDSELMRQEIFIPEGFTATIEGDKIILKKTESENERIRKELIEHVKDQQSSFISAPDCRDKYEEEENNKYNSWLSWLERQGTSYTKKDVDDAYVEGMAFAKNELKKQGEQKLPIEKLPSEMKTIGESLGFTTQEECDEYNQMVSNLIMSDDDKNKQKSAEWSEEDIYNSKLILSTINQDQDLSLETKDKLTSWLKFLKQRIGGKL